MANRSKCLKYYLDSGVYGSKEIQESIEETKKEFSDKKVYVDIILNDFGMYVLTFYFENKNKYFNKIKLKFRKKKKEKLLLEEDNLNVNKDINKKIKKQKVDKVKKDRVKTRLEKYYGKNYGKYYGKYKNTGVYKPY